MNSSSLPPDRPEEKGGYPLSPTPFWMFWFNLAAHCALHLYLLLEIISVIRCLVLRLVGSPSRFTKRSKIFNTGAATEVGLEEKDLFQEWLNRPSFETDSYEYVYPSHLTRIGMLLCMSLFAAFTKIVAILVWLDRDPEGTAMKLKEIVKSIRQRAEASEKFRLVFKKLLQLLQDVEQSPATHISRFLRTWSTQMLSYGNVWYIRFGQRRTNFKYVPQNLYESTLAMYALFHARGAGFEAYYMNGHWKEEDRCVYGALSLVMFFVFDKCYPEPGWDLVRSKGCELEQILLVDRELRFVRFVGCVSDGHEALTKDLLMWDITRNCCNDFVESSWSVSCLERVIWTLEYGLSYVSMELYESIKGQDGRRRVDMTHVNALSLISLSVAGLVRLQGLGDGPYQMFGREDAKVEVHGLLPSVTIEDLVELKLVEKRQMGSFCLRRLPGCDRKFKAVAVGDSIKFVQSGRSECFKAQMSQRVV